MEKKRRFRDERKEGHEGTEERLFSFDFNAEGNRPLNDGNGREAYREVDLQNHIL
ncbi:hypothetical cytosolic protein [Syntrophus aciditrophicus SB]|jgi:hypothetical protein|uniref:Hypothetical cytosolic protein n=1 Tax=Syntrophus aciditrophicus (strain SB) TaxID=56780 RepID=Q2LX77_SYNAS|nr:hypothetical cytosolic protein [Syntrophus aciditrophicus SB]